MKVRDFRDHPISLVLVAACLVYGLAIVLLRLPFNAVGWISANVVGTWYGLFFFERR